mgnify:CR=1 FL=1
MTQDPLAKTFYGLSMVCSASGITSGGVAVMSRTCHISGTAAVADFVVIAFFHLGNKAHTVALQMDGKPIPQHLQRYANKNIRPPYYNLNGLGFIMPGQQNFSEIIAMISFETVGKVIGFSLSIYGYSKLIIIGYRYGQQWISKYKKKEKNFRIILVY